MDEELLQPLPIAQVLWRLSLPALPDGYTANAVFRGAAYDDIGVEALAG